MNGEPTCPILMNTKAPAGTFCTTPQQALVQLPPVPRLASGQPDEPVCRRSALSLHPRRCGGVEPGTQIDRQMAGKACVYPLADAEELLRHALLTLADLPDPIARQRNLGEVDASDENRSLSKTENGWL